MAPDVSSDASDVESLKESPLKVQNLIFSSEFDTLPKQKY